MNQELSTATSGVQYQPSQVRNERKKHFKSVLKDMRKISVKPLRNFKLKKPKVTRRRPIQDIEPVKLGQRIVFRSQGQVPVKQMVAFHTLIKNDQLRASNLVSLNMRGEPTTGRNSAFLCATRNSFEE